jgi:FixJ family two-component response regulator
MRSSSSHVVDIVNHDRSVRESLADLLRSMDYQVAHYSSASDFLNVALPDAHTCTADQVKLEQDIRLMSLSAQCAVDEG